MPDGWYQVDPDYEYIVIHPDIDGLALESLNVVTFTYDVQLIRSYTNYVIQELSTSTFVSLYPEQEPVAEEIIEEVVVEETHAESEPEAESDDSQGDQTSGGEQ